MPHDDADPTAAHLASQGADRHRKWRNRQPTKSRLDLTPEEAETREAERLARQRTKAIHVQLTAAERTTIDQRSARYGMRVSDYARTVLLADLKEPPPPKTDPKAVRALAFELSKLGTNLNQLAARANEAGKISADRKLSTLLQMERELLALSAQIAAALERVITL